MTNSIIQEWVCELGLRHQGVLMSAVRGCDGALREDDSKWLVRFYRACILNSHCGDPRGAASYMLWPTEWDEAYVKFDQFKKGGFDHYPMHWLTHFMFAAEIVGYYHPEHQVRNFWNWVYRRMVDKLHLNHETKSQLDERLDADEATFADRQRVN